MQDPHDIHFQHLYVLRGIGITVQISSFMLTSIRNQTFNGNREDTINYRQHFLVVKFTVGVCFFCCPRRAAGKNSYIIEHNFIL